MALVGEMDRMASSGRDMDNLRSTICGDWMRVHVDDLRDGARRAVCGVRRDLDRRGVGPSMNVLRIGPRHRRPDGGGMIFDGWLRRWARMNNHWHRARGRAHDHRRRARGRRAKDAAARMAGATR
jgi:hypothetical protein